MSTARQLFAAVEADTKIVSVPLPALPKALSYWDDFHNCTRRLDDLSRLQHITIHDDGDVLRWDLERLSPFQRTAVLHVVIHLLERNDVTTAVEWLSQFKMISRRAPALLLDRLACLQPHELRQFWTTYVFPDLGYARQAVCLKRILHVFCDLEIGDWLPAYRSIVSSLPAPRVDPFSVVKSGECFLPLEHQQKVYDFLDEVASHVSASQNVERGVLCAAAAIALVDQHALRPGALVRIKTADVRVHQTGAVHISVVATKKQRGSERIKVTRRVKRDWCPIMKALVELRSSEASPSGFGQYLLGLSRSHASRLIGDQMEALTGERWTATDLRHTAAQRLVDSGASADQLAEFMLHNSTLVGNVYFNQSPSQAELVNRALAISPIYSALPEIHRTRTIDKEALMGMAEGHQIGGTPHGVAIAGIGACKLGQSACQKNPVLSCYGCRQFLAVREAEVHESVVSSLRPVVLDFYAAGRGDDRSPAYAQLQRTLTVASAIARDIKAGRE